MSEPYRPPGSGDQKGLGGAAKVVVGIVVIGVLGLVVALGFGANALYGQWNDFTAKTQEAFEADESEQNGETAPDSGSPDSFGDTEDSRGGAADLTAEEVFGGAPDERLEVTKDDHTAYARRTGRWDHQDCSDTGNQKVQTVLRQYDCQYRVEQAVAAEDSPIEIGNQVLVFPDESSATAASEKLEDDGIRFRIEDFDRKHHSTIQQANKRFVVASTIVIDPEGEGIGSTSFQNDASTLFSVLHGDLAAYFTWR